MRSKASRFDVLVSGLIIMAVLAIMAMFAISCTTNPGPVVTPPPQPLFDFSLVVVDDNGRLPSASVAIDGVNHRLNGQGWMIVQVEKGTYTLAIAAPDHISQLLTVDITRHTRKEVKLTKTAPPTPRLTTDGKIFRQNGAAWRWKGVTAFGLLERWRKGDDIQPFLESFKGYNLLRVFLWVPVADWKDTAWGIPSDADIHEFLDFVARRGWYVELTLLTGATPNAQQIVSHAFAEFERHENLMIELVNEPDIHNKPDTTTLIVPANTPILWTSGDYNEIGVFKVRGRYGVAHTARDGEWPRKAHDLMDYYNGGAPHSPQDPAHKFPWVADEPIRPDQAGFNEDDFEAYFGTASLLGAGATFHFDSGKWGREPNAAELRVSMAALRGLEAFPADAPNGPYSRPVEQSLRTYVVGNSMTRVRPTTPDAPLSGWFRVHEGRHILWKR